MTSVDLFLRSVRDVFARNRETDWTQVGFLLGGAVVVSITLSLVIARQRSRRETARRVDAVTTRAGLKRVDLDYLGGISRGADLALLEVMTRLPAFERATARALAAEGEALRPAPGSVFERIRRLRKVLGFSPLPSHHWLLSTRELLLGDPATIGSASGKVVEVSEASFAIDLPLTAVPALGSTVTLAIVRSDDSRYVIRTRVLSAEPVSAPAAEPGAGSAFRRVLFAHDEQPERQQNREHVRIRHHGLVNVRLIEPGRRPTGAIGTARVSAAAGRDGQDVETSGDEPVASIAGTLVDVSAGGMALDLPVSSNRPVRRGARVRCSFALGDNDPFNEFDALVVAAGAGPLPGVQHLRLSFVALADSERDRLAMAIAKQQRTPPSEAGGHQHAATERSGS